MNVTVRYGPRKNRPPNIEQAQTMTELPRNKSEKMEPVGLAREENSRDK